MDEWFLGTLICGVCMVCVSWKNKQTNKNINAFLSKTMNKPQNQKDCVRMVLMRTKSKQDNLHLYPNMHQNVLIK